MTEAMPFLQKAILLSYDPRPLSHGLIGTSFRSLTGISVRSGSPYTAHRMTARILMCSAVCSE